jgi:hypothetical protein
MIGLIVPAILLVLLGLLYIVLRGRAGNQPAQDVEDTVVTYGYGYYGWFSLDNFVVATNLRRRHTPSTLDIVVAAIIGTLLIATVTAMLVKPFVPDAPRPPIAISQPADVSQQNKSDASETAPVTPDVSSNYQAGQLCVTTPVPTKYVDTVVAHCDKILFYLTGRSLPLDRLVTKIVIKSQLFENGFTYGITVKIGKCLLSSELTIVGNELDSIKPGRPIEYGTAQPVNGVLSYSDKACKLAPLAGGK